MRRGNQGREAGKHAGTIPSPHACVSLSLPRFPLPPFPSPPSMFLEGCYVFSFPLRSTDAAPAVCHARTMHAGHVLGDSLS